MENNHSIEKYELFQYWLANMDDALDDFISSLPAEVSRKLDYSPDSLPILEAWWLSTFDDVSTALEPASKFLVDGVACYVGETFRKEIGGIWEISYEDPSNAYYGMPVINKYKRHSTPICPMTLSTTCLDQRSGNFWITVLSNIRRRLDE